MKNKSTLLKDAFALFMITLFSGLVLSFVYEVTKDQLRYRLRLERWRLIKNIYTEAEDFIEDEDFCFNK